VEERTKKAKRKDEEKKRWHEQTERKNETAGEICIV